MGHQKTYGLIGKKLDHSFSPKYFTSKFQKENIPNCVYLPFPLDDICLFINLIKNTPTIAGLNVTIPYKEKIIPYLDKLSDVAMEVGAVNTIIFKNGQLIGDNTDVYGFQKSLELFYPFDKKSKAIILGSGGASKAAQYVLKTKNIPFIVISRKKNKEYINYKQLTKAILQSHSLIINTTPLGMFPKIDRFPKIKYQYLNEQHYLYDLIYNPEETQFLIKGKQQSAHIKSGGDMLIFQAEKAWELWNL